MYKFTVAIMNGSYMFRLQNSHRQAAYAGSSKGNIIAVVVL